MTRFGKFILVAAMLLLPTLVHVGFGQAPEALANCGNDTFIGLDPWYKYLQCDGENNIQFDFPADIWLIVAAILDLIFKLAMYLAVFMVMWGGWTVLISNGNPDKVNRGRQVIINALVGMIIAILSSQLIHFVAGQF